MQRALSATPAVIDKFFAQLTDILTREGLVGRVTVRWHVECGTVMKQACVHLLFLRK